MYTQQTELQSILVDDQLKLQEEKPSAGLEYSSNGEYDTLRESVLVSLVSVIYFNFRKENLFEYGIKHNMLLYLDAQLPLKKI